MALQVYLGRFVIDGTTDTIALSGGAAPETITLASGKYFLAGYTAEGTRQLVEEIDQKLNATANYGAAAIAYSYTTGKVTISGMNAGWTLTWTDTALRDLLGFTGNLTGATSYTATNEARYQWRPTRSWSDHPGTASRVWAPRSSSLVQVARDGTTTGVVGALLYDAALAYRMLPEARILTPSTGSVNQDLERYYEDVCHKAEHTRLFPDSTATTSTSFVTGVLSGSKDAGEMPPFVDLAKRHIESYQGLWDVDLFFRKVI